MIYHIFARALRRASHMSWIKPTVIGMSLIILAAYIIPYVEGKDSGLVTWYDRVYWTVVTLSTVGYGDISPQTPTGKILVSILILVGIGLAASLITVVSDKLMSSRRTKMKGLANYSHLKGHTVFFGYTDETKTIIHEICDDPTFDVDNILIVADTVEEHPLNDDYYRVHFVKASPHSDDAMNRSGVDNASNILVCTGNDGESILTAIALNSRKEVYAPVVIHVMNIDNAKHVTRLNSRFKVVMPVVSNLMVQELQDPGIVELVGQLLSTTEGQTLCSAEYNNGLIRFIDLLTAFKIVYNDLIIGVMQEGEIVVNPQCNFMLGDRSKIFFIASGVPDIDWKRVLGVVDKIELEGCQSGNGADC